MIISLLSIANFSDLGIGLSIQYLLPKYIVRNNKQQIDIIISTAFYFLIFLGLLIIFIGLYFIENYDLRNIFGITKFIDQKTSKLTFELLIIIIGISTPINIVQRIQSAFKETYIFDLYNGLANLISMTLIFIVYKYHPNIPIFLFALQGIFILVTSINFVNFFFLSRKINLDFSKTNKKILLRLINYGLKYFFLLLVTILMFSLDSILLTKFDLFNEVPIYLIGYRMALIFNLPINIFSSVYIGYFNTNLIYDKLGYKNNFKSILLYICFGSFLQAFIISFCGNWILDIWFSGRIHMSQSNLIIFSLLVFFLNLNTFVSVIALNKKFVKYTIILFPISVLISLFFKFLLLYFGYSGIFSILFPSIFIVTIFYLIPLISKISTN